MFPEGSLQSNRDHINLPDAESSSTSMSPFKAGQSQIFQSCLVTAHESPKPYFETRYVFGDSQQRPLYCLGSPRHDGEHAKRQGRDYGLRLAAPGHAVSRALSGSAGKLSPLSQDVGPQIHMEAHRRPFSEYSSLSKGTFSTSMLICGSGKSRKLRQSSSRLQPKACIGAAEGRQKISARFS